MKILRGKLLFLEVLLLTFSLSFCSAIQLGYLAPENFAKLEKITQYSSIEGRDLYSDTLIEGYVINKTANISPGYYFWLNLQAFEQDKSFNLYNVNVMVCDNAAENWGGDYKNIYINCNKTINSVIKIDGNSLQLSFNLSQISGYSFFIKINYTLKDFLISNGNYEIAWLKTNVASEMIVPRTLMLPSINSII